MTREPTIGPEQAARNELIARLQQMSTALESGDDALFTERLHDLLRRRDEGFYLRIARITEDLQNAFAGLEGDERWNSIATELPDAGARLDHVGQLTEKATHHTLDLVDAGQAELKRMATVFAPLEALRARLVGAAGDVHAVLSVATELKTLQQQLQGHHEALRGNLSALTQAQEYQDLCGQILRRVTHVVREVEAALLKLLDGRMPQARAVPADKGLEGPTIVGLGHSAAAADQDDADALLALFMT